MDTVILNGELVAKLAAESGTMRGELADKAKISAPTSSRVFASEPVSVKTARQVAEALGVNLRRLIVRSGCNADHSSRGPIAAGAGRGVGRVRRRACRAHVP
jgi:hypothetical protein